MTSSSTRSPIGGAKAIRTKDPNSPMTPPRSPNSPPISQIQYETFSSVGIAATLNMPESPPAGSASPKFLGRSVGISKRNPPADAGWPWYPGGGAWYPGGGAWYPGGGAWYPGGGAWYPGGGAWYPGGGAWYPGGGAWYP